ncbi:hypothetical protein NL676_039670 [Syzygium grande]|nr:hypothetical protein NL676_039670 [Syzygium grande]
MPVAASRFCSGNGGLDRTRQDTEVKLPRPTRVKNKTAPPKSRSSLEVNLREARERRGGGNPTGVRSTITPTALPGPEAQGVRETSSATPGGTPAGGVRYAKGGALAISNRRYGPGRAEVDYRNRTVVEVTRDMEMKNKFINHARMVDRLWYKYIHMEEKLGNLAGARQIFKRWMNWMPDQQGWLSYIKFELRYNEVERAKGIHEGFMRCHPKVSAWIKYAKFEMKNGEVARARHVYERGVEKFADDDEAEMLFVAFAEFEERCKESREDLYRKFVAFEKQYGDREGIEDAIVGKRRFQYEDEVRKNPSNYDSWFDYICSEESVGNKERVREIYERAIANVPLAEEKQYWQRYIYLWIIDALYEELDAEDMERTWDAYGTKEYGFFTS